MAADRMMATLVPVAKHDTNVTIAGIIVNPKL